MFLKFHTRSLATIAAFTVAASMPAAGLAQAGKESTPKSSDTRPAAAAHAEKRPMPKPATRPTAKPLSESSLAPPPGFGPRPTGWAPSPNGYNDRGPIKGYAMPMDPKLIVFPYDANYSYPIYCRAGLFTRIALSPNEKVVGLYLSDQLRWVKHTAKDRESVFIMPMTDGLFNTGTLKTTVRTYELTFTVVPESDNWYHRVSWHIPVSNQEDEIDQPDPKWMQSEVDAMPSKPGQTNSAGASPSQAVVQPPIQQSGGANSANMVNVDKLNYNYQVDGSAPFKPTVVFDDGRQTWFQMPPNQDAPVFFALSKDGVAEPITPTPHPGTPFVVISRLLPYGALLKIGKDEVRIVNKQADCGFFGNDCWNKSSARNFQN